MLEEAKPLQEKTGKMQTKPLQKFVNGKLSNWDGTSGNNQ
jgi:hypothetical protein